MVTFATHFTGANFPTQQKLRILMEPDFRPLYIEEDIISSMSPEILSFYETIFDL